MNARIGIPTDKPGVIEVKITGPDNICDPVLNFLILRLANDKCTFSLYFEEEVPKE